MWEAEQVDNAVPLQDVSALRIKPEKQMVPKKQMLTEKQPARGAVPECCLLSDCNAEPVSNQLGSRCAQGSAVLELQMALDLAELSGLEEATAPHTACHAQGSSTCR